MMPAYRSMDSPYQRNQIPFPHYYHPGIEPIHPQMKLDPSKPPFSYDQHWPYAGSLGNPIPPYSCCGHNNFPCHFSYMPSHPHAPSPMYYSGTCPSYSEPYFVPYSPQPHYTMDLPRYEYDKFMPREHHCCGCPNHPCSQKEGRSVKIEEHEPDGGKKVNDALAPIQLKNYPYPLVWIPQEFTSNKQLKNPNTMEVGEQDKPPRCENSNADAHPAQEPRVWNGWPPFNIKGAPNVIHNGYGTRNQKEESGNNRGESEDGKVDQKHQSEQNRSEFPFPIIWLPYYNEPEESGETKNQEKNTFSPKVIEEVPHTFKSVPVKSHVDEGGRNRNGTGLNQAENTNTNAADVIEKVTNARSIPVKQMEENVTVDQKHQSEQNRSEFPFPIFWLPYNKPEESGETKNQEKNTFSPKIIEEVPHTFKFVPVKSHVDEGGRNRNGTGSNQAEYTNTNAADVVEKVTNARSIPVKQMEENVTKKDSCTGDKKRQSASSPKGSKLPPVCLRVDPLPRKKNGNGSLSSRSRSPSPPSSKGQSRATTGETFKTPVSGTHDKGQPNSDHQNAPTNTIERVKPKEKTIPVSEICKTNENQGVDCRDGCQSQINVNIPSEDPKGTRETCPDGDDFKTEDKKAEKRAEKMRENTEELRDVKDSSAQTEAGQKKGRVLADADAAVLIQSAYRGHQVRKWEPLKKLKQIDEVRKEVTDVRGRVQAFERCSDLQNVDKQKIAIGETIMRLLLKLDTIQGLHPSFREIRKSLARELTILQERLDYIMAKKPQQQVQDFNVQEHVEVTPMNMQNEEQVAVPVDSAEGISDDAKGPGANVGGSKSQSPVDPTSDKGAESVVLPNGSDNDDTCQVVTDDTLNSTSELSETDKMAVESEAKSEVKDIPTVEDILNKVDNLYKTALEELPIEVVDEDINDVIIEKEKQDDVSSGSLQAMVDDSARDGLENHAMMELAVGLFDEDERDYEMNISKEGTQTKEGEFNADEKISSSTDNTAEETELEQQKKLEEQEVHSSGESDDRVKIEYQEGGELNGDAPMEIRTECKLGEEVENDTELPPFTTQVNDHGPGNEDVCSKANDVNDVTNMLPESEPMVFVPSNDRQKGEEPEEKISLTKTQEMVTEQVIGADDKDTEASSQEKTEVSAAPPALQELELPAAEHDVELNGDMKLQEENEKLSEMMKKLLDAGNEQLSVISNLTGRVKDLEKKLARSRSKRLKTKRYRPATSKISCMK